MNGLARGGGEVGEEGREERRGSGKWRDLEDLDDRYGAGSPREALSPSEAAAACCSQACALLET